MPNLYLGIEHLLSPEPPAAVEPANSRPDISDILRQIAAHNNANPDMPPLTFSINLYLAR